MLTVTHKIEEDKWCYYNRKLRDRRWRDVIDASTSLNSSQDLNAWADEMIN